MLMPQRARVAEAETSASGTTDCSTLHLLTPLNCHRAWNFDELRLFGWERFATSRILSPAHKITRRGIAKHRIGTVDDLGIFVGRPSTLRQRQRYSFRHDSKSRLSVPNAATETIVNQPCRLDWWRSTEERAEADQGDFRPLGSAEMLADGGGDDLTMEFIY